MQTPTTRVSLRKMNSDGSDMVDVENQYNVNMDILDESFTTRDVNSGPRPNSSTGIVLYENDSESQLVSVGSNEWNVLATYGAMYEKAFTSGSINGFTDTYMNIFDASQNNIYVEGVSTDTVRLKLPGLYYLEANFRYAVNNASGLYLLALEYYNLTGTRLKITQESDIKGNENMPMSLKIQTLHRVLSVFPQNVKLLTYQNSSGTRTVENTASDGSTLMRFQATYIRPIVQGV